MERVLVKDSHYVQYHIHYKQWFVFNNRSKYIFNKRLRNRNIMLRENVGFTCNNMQYWMGVA